ncbi:MAG: FG-GAP and VCBS repeat-containing protein, partial [Thermoleophilaceae bacterium]
NEMRQLLATGSFGSQSQVDDVNFTTSSLASPTPEPSCSPAPAPGCTDPNQALQANVNGVRPIASPPDSRSYPARKGPDQFYGYGRLNAFRAADAASKGQVPPEVEVTSPEWFDQVDPGKATAALGAQVWARGQSYTCSVYVAPGSYPNNDPTPAGDMEKLGGKQIPAGGCDGSTKHTGRIDGTVANIDIAHLRSRFPSDRNDFRGPESGSGLGQNSGGNGRPDSEPYGFTVRVVATTVPPLGQTAATGDDRRNLYLHRDQDLMKGFPRRLPGDGASSPAFADLNGDNRNELVFATSDGIVHAMHPDGSELRGWPVRTDPLPLHIGPAFTSGAVDRARGAVLASVAVGDVNGDGSPEVVVADFEGKVYVWNADGSLRWKREANPNYSGKPLHPFENVRKGNFNRTQHGFIGSPVLANLAGRNGGPLDVIVAGMDRHVYAFGPDGKTLPGYPVLVVDRDKVASIDPVTHRVNFNTAKTGSSSDDLETNQGAIIDTPAVGDLDGDGKPEIVVGTNEEYRTGDGDEPGPNTSGNLSFSAIGVSGLLSNANGRLFAIKSTGDRDGKPLTPDWSVGGHWPVKLAILNANLLPVVGEGVTGAPVIGPKTLDCGGNGGKGPKVGAIPNNGFGYILNKDGSSCLGADSSGHYATLQTDSGSGDVDRPDFPAVGHPAFGNFAGGVSFLSPVTGLLRALDVVFPEYQTGSEDFVAAWNPSSGSFRQGFPAHMNDLQFLTGPSVADIDGKAGEELIAGSAYLDLEAYNGGGKPAGPTWPKLSSGWMVANPLIGSFGTLDTAVTARKTVLSMTRDGLMFAYRTPAKPCSPGSWPRFHHDDANSGDYSRDAVAPGVPMGAKFAAGRLTFKAPGDDLLCGRAARYQLVESDRKLSPGSFAQGIPVPVTAKPKAPGSADSIELGGKLQRFLMLRAVDDQGNVGRMVRVATGAHGGKPPPPPPPGKKPTCVDRKPPISAIISRSVKQRGAAGITVRGHSYDSGCHNRKVAKRRNAIAASVALARRGHGACRWLTPSRDFSKPRGCGRPTFFTARGTYSHRTKRLTWSFHTSAKLAPGSYVAMARAVDQSGNVETHFTRRNRKEFKVLGAR